MKLHVEEPYQILEPSYTHVKDNFQNTFSRLGKNKRLANTKTERDLISTYDFATGVVKFTFLYIQKLKLLVIACGCTARFVSDPMGVKLLISVVLRFEVHTFSEPFPKFS